MTHDEMRAEIDALAETARREWDEATKKAARHEARLKALEAVLEAAG